MFEVSIAMEIKWGTKTICCQIMWWWTSLGERCTRWYYTVNASGVPDRVVYEFNGKALWEHTPQEIRKMISGDWRWTDVFFFILVSLFFGLLCRAGFPGVRHAGGKINESKLCRVDIPITRKTTFLFKQRASRCCVWPDWTNTTHHNELENADTCSMSSVMKHLFLLEFFCFYLSASQPQIVDGQAARGGDRDIRYLHMFFRRWWGQHFSHFVTNHLNWYVLQWLVSFSWCWLVQFRPNVREHICPL